MFLKKPKWRKQMEKKQKKRGKIATLCLISLILNYCRKSYLNKNLSQWPQDLLKVITVLSALSFSTSSLWSRENREDFSVRQYDADTYASGAREWTKHYSCSNNCEKGSNIYQLWLVFLLAFLNQLHPLLQNEEQLWLLF